MKVTHLNVVKHHKKTWKSWQTDLMRQTIAHDMINDGGVDFYMLAGKVGRTVAACIKKAEDMGLSYRQRRKPREEYAPIRFIKGDMMGLPDHKNGAEVWYE